MRDDAVSHYIQKYGKKGQAFVESLASLHSFVEAFRSEVGSQILKDDVERMRKLMERHVELLDAMPIAELVELKYLKGRLETISDTIVKFEKGSREILNDGKEERAV